MIRLASTSSMGCPRKMIRSFRRREKISYARSPRLVCSTTMGTRYMGNPPPLAPAACAGGPPLRDGNEVVIVQNPRLREEKLHGFPLANVGRDRLHATLAAQVGPEFIRLLVEHRRQLLHLSLHLVGGGRNPFLSRDGVENQDVPGPLPSRLLQLQTERDISFQAFRATAPRGGKVAKHPLHFSAHQAFGDLNGMGGCDLLHHLPLEALFLRVLLPRENVLTDLLPELPKRSALAHGFGKGVIQGRDPLLLDLLHREPKEDLLPLEVLPGIIGGKGHRDIPEFPLLGADETLVHTREQLARAELQGEILHPKVLP